MFQVACALSALSDVPQLPLPCVLALLKLVVHFIRLVSDSEMLLPPILDLGNELALEKCKHKFSGDLCLCVCESVKIFI